MSVPMQINLSEAARNAHRTRRHSARLLPAALFLATTLLLLTGCESASPDPGFGAGQPFVQPDREQPGPTLLPTPRATGSGANAGPAAVPRDVESESDRFQRECEAGLNQWTSGQVDYPVIIRVSLNNPRIYNVVVDVQDVKLPADQVIELDQGVARDEEVMVQCDIAARLTSASESVEVTQTSATAFDGWVLRTFSPLGVAEWSWRILATTPVDQELQLELQPAVLQEHELPGLSEARVASFTSHVKVDATPIERVSYWFQTEWPSLLAVIGTLAAATAAVALWWERYFSRAARMKRRGQSARLP